MNGLEPILAPMETQAWERSAFAGGVDPLLLMEDAARALCDRLLPLLGPPIGKRVLILCGCGNNGGDGAALARLLLREGCETRLVSLGAPKTDSARVMRRYYEALGGRAITCADTDGWTSLCPALDAFHPDCVVDAIFGTGFHGEPDALSAEAILWLNHRTTPTVFSVDIPSGMNGADGKAAVQRVTGEPLCVRATHTVTLGCWKPGPLLTRMPEYVGSLRLAPLSLPAPASDTWTLTPEALRWIAPRAANAHKGTAGRVLMYMGSEGMAGAAAMAAKAALRAGAGLVTIACPHPLIPVLQTLVPNAMCVPAESVVERIPPHNVLAAGCGLGHSDQARACLERLLARETGPVILDADALNLLAGEPVALPPHAALTPHPGEAARLLSVPVEDVLDDPLQAARAIAEKYQSVVLLKGHVSVVTDGTRVLVQRRGAPALAKGGSGDALTGILAALCADRAVCGEFADSERLLFRTALASLWLGLAGEEAQRQWGDRSALTGDVIDQLGRVLACPLNA